MILYINKHNITEGYTMNLEKKGLVITVSILAALAVIMTLTLNTIAVLGIITSVPSSDIKGQISTVPEIRLPEDVLTYINLSRAELQRHNVTGALAQLDLAAHSVSAIHDKIWSISRDLSVLAYTIKGQNITTGNDDRFNFLKQNNEHKEHLLMEPATYNALVSIVLARNDLHNGNIKGALMELDSATQSISDFTRILLSTANRIRSINDEWMAGG
jgi:hypothetical protein